MFTKVEQSDTCDDNALLLGTAEEAITYWQRFNRHRVEQEPMPQVLYAVTELLTLQFPTEPSLADVNTVAGRQFADLVKCILGQSGLTRLLWGTVVEEPSTCKLLLDWQNVSAYDALRSSESFSNILRSLEMACDATSYSQCFNLGDDFARRSCFPSESSWVKFVTAFYVWRFNTPIRDYEIVPASAKENNCNQTAVARTFPVHWTNYALHAYRRYTKCWGGGWLIRDPVTAYQEELPSRDEPDIYCGMIGARTLKRSRAILDEAENLSYEDGGIAELKGMADGGLEVFHVGFTNLISGWHGCVTKESADPLGRYGPLFRCDPSAPGSTDMPTGLFGQGAQNGEAQTDGSVNGSGICSFPLSACGDFD